MRVVPMDERGKELSRMARSRPQATYFTPLKDLDNFVNTLSPFLGDLVSATLIVEVEVFDPTHLQELVAGETWFKGSLVQAEGKRESLQLLNALSDWTDFLFGPEPATMLIYADHDEFVTFFPRNVLALARLLVTLDRAGYERVKYRRKL